MADKVWGINSINNSYLALMEKVKSGYSLKEAWKEYSEILVKDPYLPKQLLSKNWAREKLLALIKSSRPGQKNQ